MGSELDVIGLQRVTIIVTYRNEITALNKVKWTELTRDVFTHHHTFSSVMLHNDPKWTECLNLPNCPFTFNVKDPKLSTALSDNTIQSFERVIKTNHLILFSEIIFFIWIITRNIYRGRVFKYSLTASWLYRASTISNLF